jgi:integrase
MSQFTPKIFAPNDYSKTEVSNWTISEFFELWYLPSVKENLRRRPPTNATLDRRKVAVAWWSRLMGSNEQKDGPALSAITADDLETFQTRLKSATYRRGEGVSRPLSEWSQFRTFREIQFLLNSAGSTTGRTRRADILRKVPGIYTETPPAWPKETWDISEARQLAKFVGSMNSTKAKLSKRKYRALAEATLAFWYFTGHRATTYETLKFVDLVEVRGGAFLQIRKSVKTGKPDRLRVHPQLHERLLRVQSIFRSKWLIPWPVEYRCISDYHKAWQEAAGFAANRRFSPQAWRRLHASMIAAVGYETARSFAATAMGHSSASITEAHYVSVRDLAIANMPALF